MAVAVPSAMGRGVQRFTNLRAWQACDVYKKAVYRLCEQSPLSTDWRLRDQPRESVAGPPSHLAEGFGRFSPPDFARYAVIARASLMESQNHLLDAIDRRHITEQLLAELDLLAEVAIKDVTGLMEYLQPPEALRNARRARERRIATRQQRHASRAQSVPHAAVAGEPARQDREPHAEAPPQRTVANTAPRTPNPEHEPEHEPRTENAEE